MSSALRHTSSIAAHVVCWGAVLIPKRIPRTLRAVSRVEQALRSGGAHQRTPTPVPSSPPRFWPFRSGSPPPPPSRADFPSERQARDADRGRPEQHDEQGGEDAE